MTFPCLLRLTQRGRVAATALLRGGAGVEGAGRCLVRGLLLLVASALAPVFAQSGAAFTISVPAIGSAGVVAPATITAPAGYTGFQNAIRQIDFSSAMANPASGSGTLSLDAYESASNTSAAFVAISTSSTRVAVYFDANGVGRFDLKFSDVGQLTLSAFWQRSHEADDVSLSTPVNATGSASWTVKPYALRLSSIACADGSANPAAADASGGRFCRAGAAFSITIDLQNADAALVNNFGAESTPQGVTLTHALTLPAGGAAGLLSGTATIPGASFQAATKGQATVTDLSWSEVGIITLTAANRYLGLSGADTSGVSGNIGRFYPDHFTMKKGFVGNRAALATTGNLSSGSNALSVASAANIRAGEAIAVDGAGGAGVTLNTTVSAVSGNDVTLAAPAGASVTDAAVHSGRFTYMGEAFRLSASIEAQNAAGAVTQNFTGAFADAARGHGVVSVAAENANDGVDRQGQLSGASGAWASGVYTLNANVLWARPTAASAAAAGPFEAVDFSMAVTDGDGPVLQDLDTNPGSSVGANTHKSLGSSRIRFGQMLLYPGYGSELSTLALPIQMQYWNGQSFQKNSDDNLTAVALSQVAANETANTWLQIIAPLSSLTVAKGEARVRLASRDRTRGRVLPFRVDLSGMTYLRTNVPAGIDASCTTSAFACDPAAPVIFGLYQKSRHVVWMRERR